MRLRALLSRFSVQALRLCFASALLLRAVPAFAEGTWDAMLTDSPQLPRQLLAVDKSTQQLFLYERKSPLRLAERFTCTTGQRPGDKLLSGDLRTPEGVYFVVGKVRMALDFEKYGGVGYALNYPNPMDKLRGKTGHGIWIHSRGRAITPRETEGCIAVDLHDMRVLEPSLAPGTAVVVADTVRTDAAPTGPDAAVSNLLERKTREWNAAWAARSETMFDFYNPEAYSRAQGESFRAFREQKERLFKKLAWIHIVHGDVQVLRGPGYWVSWFNQYYRAPNLSTEGIRRLYWQPDAAGELRIVGMDWEPENLGMETAYLESVTAGVAEFVERWRTAWERADLAGYMNCYASDAVQQPHSGAAAIERHKRLTWAKGKPARVMLNGLRVMVRQGAVCADMTQIYSNTRGYTDKGVKRIVLHPKGNSWVIVAEEWSPLTP